MNLRRAMMTEDMTAMINMQENNFYSIDDFKIDQKEKDYGYTKDDCEKIADRILEIAAAHCKEVVKLRASSKLADPSSIKICRETIEGFIENEKNVFLKTGLQLILGSNSSEDIEKILWELVSPPESFCEKFQDKNDLFLSDNYIARQLIVLGTFCIKYNEKPDKIKLRLYNVLGKKLGELEEEWDNKEVDELNSELYELYFLRAELHSINKEWDDAVEYFDIAYWAADDEGVDEFQEECHKQLCLACEKKQTALTYEQRIAPASEKINKLKNANPEKIGEIIDLGGEEEYTEFAASLALFEEYELLEKLFKEAEASPFKITKEKLLNSRVQPQFAFYEPTPFFYVSGVYAAQKMKDQGRMLKYLKEKGADVDMESGEGFTPLINQCYNSGSPLIIKTLLDLGADPNKACVSNEVAWTPLLFCLAPVTDEEDEKKILPYSDKLTEKIKILLENKADPNLVSETMRDFSPLMLALQCMSLLKSDAEKGSSFPNLTFDNYPCEGSFETISSGAPCNNLIVIEMLLKYGADPAFIDSNGVSLLDYADKNKLQSAVELLQKFGAQETTDKVKNENAKDLYKRGISEMRKKFYDAAIWSFLKAVKADFANKKYHEAFANALLKRGLTPLKKENEKKAEALYLKAKEEKSLKSQDMFLEAALLGHLDSAYELRTSYIIAVITSPEGKALHNLLVKADYPPALYAQAHNYPFYNGGSARKKTMEFLQRAADLGYQPARKKIKDIIRTENEDKEQAEKAREYSRQNPPLKGEEKKKCEDELDIMLRALARKATILKPEKCKTPLPPKQMLSSHAGGIPYFEEGAVWPCNENGEPLIFSLQIFQDSTNSLVMPPDIKLVQVFLDLDEEEEHIVVYHELNTEKAALIDCPVDSEDILGYMTLSFNNIEMLPDYCYIRENSPDVIALAEKIYPGRCEYVIEDHLDALGFKEHDDESYLGGFFGYLSNSSLGSERRKSEVFFQLYLESDGEGPYGWRRWDDAMIYAAYDAEEKKVKSELDINYD